MADLTANVTVYSILLNRDVPNTYSVKGQILMSGSPVGDFVADYVDAATAGAMTVGSTYPVSMTV